MNLTAAGPIAAAVPLAPDPVLPHRDRLLDDAAVSERLGVRCTRIRAKYRVGESLRVTFRVDDESAPERAGLAAGRVVSARMFAPGADGVQAERAVCAAREAGAGPDAVRHDPELGVVLWTFPHDRRLTGLDVLTDPPPALRGAFGAPWARSTLMAYSPEKAATARWEDGSGEALGYAKVQVGDDCARSVATLRAVRAALAGPTDPADPGTPGTPGGSGSPALADVVAFHPGHRLALYSVAPGRSLHDLARPLVPAAMAALGTALRHLHAGAADVPAFTRLDPARLRTARDLVALARPDVADLVHSVVAALLERRPGPAPAALLHGDLHPKNVLVQSDPDAPARGISLVDLDQAATGPAAAELGGLLARLWCPRPNDTLDAGAAHDAAQALLAGYGHVPPMSDLVWHAAAALVVERAVRAVSRVDVVGLDRLSDVLATAARWATSPQEAPR